MVDLTRQPAAMDRSGGISMFNASRDVLVPNNGETMREDKEMFAHKDTLPSWPPSLDPFPTIGVLSRDFKKAATPREAVDAVLKHLHPEDNDFNKMILSGLSNVWLDVEADIPPERRWKKGFLLVLEKDWADCRSPRMLLEAVRRRLSGEIERDSKLLSDTALLVILKTRFEGMSVKESLPKLQSRLEVRKPA